jgi:hypothetical protein
MINKHLVKQFNALLTRSRSQKIGGVETTLYPRGVRKKKGTQPDLLRPPVSYVRTRKLPAIAVAVSIPPTSTAVTIAVCHRFGLIHGERAPVELGPV